MVAGQEMSTLQKRRWQLLSHPLPVCDIAPDAEPWQMSEGRCWTTANVQCRRKWLLVVIYSVVMMLCAYDIYVTAAPGR